MEVKREEREKEMVHRTKVIQFLGRTTPIILQNDNGPCPLLAICNSLLSPTLARALWLCLLVHVKQKKMENLGGIGIRMSLSSQSPLRVMLMVFSFVVLLELNMAVGKTKMMMWPQHYDMLSVSFFKFVFWGNVLSLKNSLNLSPDISEVSQEKLLSLVAERLIDTNINIDNKDAGYVENQQQNIADAIDLLPRLTTGIDVNIKFRRIDDFEFTPECAIFDLLDIPLYHGWIVDPQCQGK
ncbi:UNVERIFIED_CONTAM: Ubiquitin carboxyl-terminal hydrolase MINDY-1 [Sesamum latifolium]|uniref:Ubiquitin carboxyl-terminal hydrolase MINDY-1 n=1 Tax=Sesamum latifolium TaxID=2727402 RepID=A0AAW2SMX5_9LAMI